MEGETIGVLETRLLEFEDLDDSTDCIDGVRNMGMRFGELVAIGCIALKTFVKRTLALDSLGITYLPGH
ncbi:unnamed protein product [Clonostachys rosea]|uniref:Uncharacterized protein n=1 Tax=Bionectria ochroleuca TaxID=29856 RepID=A0ABY6UAA3_BIOOC|nr:unnamed protein product [Clonostachys rosea]